MHNRIQAGALQYARVLVATDTARQAHTGPPARQPPLIPQQLSRRATGTHWKSQALPGAAISPSTTWLAHASVPKRASPNFRTPRLARSRRSDQRPTPCFRWWRIKLTLAGRRGAFGGRVAGLGGAGWWRCQSSPPVDHNDGDGAIQSISRKGSVMFSGVPVQCRSGALDRQEFCDICDCESRVTGRVTLLIAGISLANLPLKPGGIEPCTRRTPLTPLNAWRKKVGRE